MLTWNLTKKHSWSITLGFKRWPLRQVFKEIQGTRESEREKNQINNWKSLQMQKRTIRGSEWHWKGTARKEFEIRCPLCPLNRPVAVVSLVHNALSADKQSLKTQTHHSQSVPVKGNLAYWCPFHSSQLKPADISFLTPRTVNMQKSTRVFVMLRTVSKRLWWVRFHPGKCQTTCLLWTKAPFTNKDKTQNDQTKL